MVRNAIVKMKNFFNFQEYTWWMEFLNNPTKTTPKITRWPLTHLQKIHKIQDIPKQLVPTADAEPTCISEMLENEGLAREFWSWAKSDMDSRSFCPLVKASHNISVIDINHILKLNQDWKPEKLPELINKIHKEIKLQESLVYGAFYGHGDFELSSSASHLQCTKSL
ncbi:unnamed protein product [Mytilus coruscus]|uniref:Uncharacterized protein n=1 Tax=Mytilus coruscus TaxID=42192 RepID=A0A6J8EWH0_MYTCO|nr:unnamed protein product [Mytilus coruscus]